MSDNAPFPAPGDPGRYEALAREIAEICEDKRARDVTVLDMHGLCSYADFFVIATGASLPQMKGIQKDTDKRMSELGVKQLNRSGIEHGNWVLLDYGDVILHLFDEQTRDFYRLEELWGDAPVLKRKGATS